MPEKLRFIRMGEEIINLEMIMMVRTPSDNEAYVKFQNGGETELFGDQAATLLAALKAYTMEVQY